ncbi:hypothetical protein N7516_010294 [Penicillium verrucosum]|uniref:uncharacterized protein n=1 Tax=Penicillium verrucosum TaxID=60171 RepID=UPI00254571B0|nr:uncharacterized protein N7516_010294 [Penicillium verrucosum]KAJ5922591.1 hypothetical protein N7516_010294 [Penicillium verrucosum]
MDVASANLQEYITDIRRLFQCLQAYNIKLEPKKAYIGFHRVSILGQRVDALGMSTPEEKLRAIADLQFPDTLQKLETYHTLIRKTALLRGSPLTGRPRQEWAKKTRYGDPTDEEPQSFEILESNFKTTHCYRQQAGCIGTVAGKPTLMWTHHNRHAISATRPEL